MQASQARVHSTIYRSRIVRVNRASLIFSLRCVQYASNDNDVIIDMRKFYQFWVYSSTRQRENECGKNINWGYVDWIKHVLFVAGVLDSIQFIHFSFGSGYIFITWIWRKRKRRKKEPRFFKKSICIYDFLSLPNYSHENITKRQQNWLSGIVINREKHGTWLLHGTWVTIGRIFPFRPFRTGDVA